MFTALLDSCVLWPSTQRDFLLSLAFEGAYRFIFSEAILTEVELNEELKRRDRGDSPEVAVERARTLASRMRDSFQDSMICGWEGLDGTFGLPDINDEHVLAAAVVGGAGSIVTDNLRDFPDNKMPDGIQAISAKEFALETVSMRPDLALAAVQTMSARSGRRYASQSPTNILDTLDKIYGMHSATRIIRDLL